MINARRNKVKPKNKCAKMSPNILKNTLAIMHQSKTLLTLFLRPLVNFKSIDVRDFNHLHISPAVDNLSISYHPNQKSFKDLC